MRWMENLRLRINENAESEVLELISILKAEMKKSKKLLDWHIYRHAQIGGDVSILLYWKTTQVEPEGSKLAYSLNKILSPFGMVDHSIWVSQRSLKNE